MPFSTVLRIDLRRLILLLTTAAALLTLANVFYASYRVQQDLLIKQTLEANRVYAAKLAISTEHFLSGLHQQLAYSADLLPELLDNPRRLREETERLRLQAAGFNSTLIVDAQGKVLATSPRDPHQIGKRLESSGVQQALLERQPLISAPYVSASGNLMVVISQPLQDSAGRYLGYVAGTLYLRQPSALSALLGEHYYRDGSYLYVVDRNRQLLYHPDPTRVGAPVEDNAVIEAALQGRAGSERLINSRGIDMLAGFAPIASTGWGVIAQRPSEDTLAMLDDLMLSVLANAIPLTVLTLLGIWWLARLISQPLWQLANNVQQMDSQAASEEIRRIRSWYYEAAQLKRAMLAGLASVQQKIGKLNLDTQTDPLTGLYNRRGLQLTLQQWQADGQSFAVLAVDIDHFKRINDTYGHTLGDQALKHLAGLMRESSRGNDVLCRSGGEEFIMLLPDTSQEAALRVAERLRRHTENTPLQEVVYITLSVGVAHWPQNAATPESVLRLADQALYAAKREGRNRIVSAPAEPASDTLQPH